ncbi:MAG: helix-turn-helix transcriptional regulator [Sphingomonadales bacterium]|jgi:AraC-like DNA-binding protein|nr:helix-turn-helix transcriptional regulator [Sphingomonadales bacterium]MBK9587297.1 helix-turn-helix transcriptional regulator [Sphingomonadales bacterium]MBL0000263.1 helix-turn-helix transcriptional regulator [Sphingomonadales bacterium]MBP7136654.1 helix-turn-helix transcriptional regulator [Sphingomonadaceae bacterium]
MLHFHDFDMMVRGGSIALLVLWGWLLVRDHWRALPARLAVAMNFSIACHVVATVPGHAPFGFFFNWIIELGSVTVPALFWLFARTWFNDERQIGLRSWSLLPVCMILVVLVEANFESRSPLFYASAAMLRAFMFGFAIAGLWIAWKGREDDLVEERRRLRVQMIGAVGTYVVLTNAVEVAVFNGFAPEFLRSLLQFGIVVLTFAFCAAMFAIRRADLLGPAQRVDESAAVFLRDDPLAGRLIAHMETERPYRDETMTIAKLAAQLGEPEYRLRRLINGQLGHRNFAAFLNGYRLDEVRAALSDPDQRQVPILTIALDAGFGSLGPFNRAFREVAGMTPTEYRSRAA